MPFLSRLLLTVSAASMLVIVGTIGAQAGQSATDEQPSLVEDFSYPGADAIFASTGVTLISGDGHILFADCAAPPTGNIGVIRIRTTEAVGNKGLICFKVTASTGKLGLWVPAVYEIRGDGLSAGAGHKLTADLTTDTGQHTTVTVNPSGNTPVGVGANPGNAPTTLLQLIVST
jgi:hypothetical protein